MVRQVSQDKTFDTIEFNEFLTMLGKQNSENIKFESLVEAFGSVNFSRNRNPNNNPAGCLIKTMMAS